MSYKKTTYLFLLMFSYTLAMSGETDQSVDIKKAYPQISFVKTIHSDSDIVSKQSISTKLKNLVFGKIDHSLSRPVSVVVPKSQEIFILDQGRQDLVIFKKIQESRTTDARFPSLVAACLGPGSSILFTDSQLNKILVFDVLDGKTTEITTNIELNRPTGITWLKSKNEIWVVESGSHRIAVLDKSGNLIRYIGERGTKSGSFNFPTAIWFDGQDNVYIIDSMNYRVQILDVDGHSVSAFGEQGDGSGYFGRPRSIACDSYGHIYVVDALFHTIQIFDQKGNFLSHFGKQGKQPGELWMPSGIFIDKQNTIYVADTYNARIQVFQLNWNGAHVEE